MHSVPYALALLTPWNIDKPKVRIGPKRDGGYVLADILQPEQNVLSYGISNEIGFDNAMVSLGHNVFMFDHTIEPLSPANPRMKFYKEGVAGTTQPEASLYTIEDHLSRLNIAGDNLILKMDVEGAEFEALMDLPLATLRRFSQITMEVHFLGRLAEDEYRRDFVKLFRKFNSLMTLHHVHANNHDGSLLHFVRGMPTCSLLELSYVRSDLVSSSPSVSLYPTHMDYPNIPGPDKLLWFFPFLPAHPTVEDFDRCAERNEHFR